MCCSDCVGVLALKRGRYRSRMRANLDTASSSTGTNTPNMTAAGLPYPCQCKGVWLVSVNTRSDCSVGRHPVFECTGEAGVRTLVPHEQRITYHAQGTSTRSWVVRTPHAAL